MNFRHVDRIIRLLALPQILFFLSASFLVSPPLPIKGKDVSRPADYVLVPLISEAAPPVDYLNGPSLVQLPAWLPHHKRLQALEDGHTVVAHWYLYLGVHGGPQINLVWSSDDEITSATQWRIYGNEGTYTPVVSLTQVQDVPNVSSKRPDLGSPDVLLDTSGQQFVLYLHSAHGCYVEEADHLIVERQCTYALVSTDGLHFNTVSSDARPQALIGSYVKPLYFADRPHMYGISEKGLFEAPPSNLASWTASGGQRDIMAWKRYDEAITQLKDFVLGKTNDFARLNHVGAAFVSEQLVEVTFNCKGRAGYVSIEDGRHQFGFMWRAFLNTSDPAASNWRFLVDGTGELIHQVLLDKERMQAELQLDPSMAHVTDGDIFVGRSLISDRCLRYFVVSYGTNITGEGHIAVFGIAGGDEDSVNSCIPSNIHAPVFGGPLASGLGIGLLAPLPSIKLPASPQLPLPYDVERLTLRVLRGVKGRCATPTLIRIPDFVPPEQRISLSGQLARWYMYFSITGQNNVYMTWTTSRDLTNTSIWHVYSDESGEPKPVMTISNTLDENSQLSLGGAVADPTGNRIFLFVATDQGCQTTSSAEQPIGLLECTFALVSRNGLDFSEPSGAQMRQPLAGPGLHVFRGLAWPTLHGVSEGGVLWHAREPAQADVTAWEADYRFTGVLRQYVQNAHGPSAEVAAVTAAIVRNGLLEIIFAVRMPTARASAANAGALHQTFVDVSSPSPMSWKFVTDESGGLAARKMLGRIHLKASGSWIYTYPSAIDLTMHTSEVDGTCHRYLAVAYGKKNHGEGRVAILRLREPGEAACVTYNGNV